MQLKDQWSKDLDLIIRHFTVASGRIEQQLTDMSQGSLKTAVCQLYTDLSSTFGTMINLCRSGMTVSSLVAATLLRGLIESMISIFAFAKDAETRADLYLSFQAVLDFKALCCHEVNQGCPHLPEDVITDDKLTERRRITSEALKRVGTAFLRKCPGSEDEAERTLAECLRARPEEALHAFRERWFPESRRDVLIAEKMGWIYPVHYQRLCSAVHSDAAASKVFGGFPKDRFIDLAMEFWSAGLYRLIDELGIRVDSQTKGGLRQCYESLQWG